MIEQAGEHMVSKNKSIVPGNIAILLVLVVFCGISINSGAREMTCPGSPNGNFRIVFYNVENLFDTANQEGKNDDAFTPSGDRRWTSNRLSNKLNNLYKALAAAGGWETPAIIGLCEVENRDVLEMLVAGTGLSKSGYEIVHRNSADRRGIDVAVLYRPEDLYLLRTGYRAVRFPFDTLATTRDILYLKGIAGIADTLHVFVNHWPSRWGGQAGTEPYRNYAASVLRSMADSIFDLNPWANIIIMGDFNDEPYNMSLKTFLGAGFGYDNPEAGNLYNISRETKKRGQDSYKFQGEWFLFDQFIVSGSLLAGSGTLRTCPLSVRVFKTDFLMVTDYAWFGLKPFRTYEGYRHTGGYSDHLPVVLDLWW